MTFKPPFPPAAVEYIRIHQDEWPKVLAYRISVLFGYPCTHKGVRGQIKKLKEEATHEPMQAEAT